MEQKHKTDKELTSLLSKGDEQAFRELYIRYKDRLWSFCFSFLKSREETHDMVQEVFIRLWEVRSFINPDLSFSSFLYTMTKNRILNYFRDMDVEAQVKKALAQKLIHEEVEVIESELIFSEYKKILTDAINLLSPQRKRIFNMSRTDNMTHNEIATSLGISVYTVQEHISESLKFIRKYFTEHSDLALSILALTFLI